VEEEVFQGAFLSGPDRIPREEQMSARREVRSQEAGIADSQKRVLFCRSNPIDPDPRVEKEASALVEAGYQVDVIAWDRTGSLLSEEIKEGVTIHRLPIQSEYACGLSNLPALLRWQGGLAKWLIQHRREYDLIHACDFDTVIPSLLCKFLYSKKVVYDVFDFYADHLRATPGWIKAVIRRLDLLAVGWSDALILVDESRRDQISGARPKRVIVINNSPRDRYHDLQSQTQEGAEGLRLVYVGLLQVERGLLELLEVMERHPNWTLELGGFGGDQDLILEKMEKLGNVHWHGRIPYARALELTAVSDVSVATYDPEIPNHRYASPNKIFEAMMLEKPVIVARNTNMDRIVEAHKCGLVVEYGDVEGLEQALMRIDSSPDLGEKLGVNGREAYESHYAWSKMKARLLDLYQEIFQ
jgi:glycosyltransferase involved in cell wall biosynthesis